MGNPEASPPFLRAGWAVRVLRDLWTCEAGRATQRPKRSVAKAGLGGDTPRLLPG